MLSSLYVRVVLSSLYVCVVLSSSSFVSPICLCCTANLDPAAFEHRLDGEHLGVYAGWSSIDDGPVHKSVLSIGFNPYFQGKERTLENYIMHVFPKDFYGSIMKLTICAYLRPQSDFKDMGTVHVFPQLVDCGHPLMITAMCACCVIDSLITAIRKDVDVASALLDRPDMQELASDSFLSGPAPSPEPSQSSVASHSSRL